MKELLTVFVTVFVAELGDKTQIATVLFASQKDARPWRILCVASLALVSSTVLAVLLGSTAKNFVQGLPLKLIAGVIFLALGAWSITEHFRAAP